MLQKKKREIIRCDTKISLILSIIFLSPNTWVIYLIRDFKQRKERKIKRGWENGKSSCLDPPFHHFQMPLPYNSMFEPLL